MSCCDETIPETHTLTRGATLRWTGVVTDDADVPVDITALVLQSQVRLDSAAATLVASATITKANQGTNPGEYEGVFPSTVAWPLQKLLWDILVKDGADTLISRKRYIRVDRAATEYTP